VHDLTSAPLQVVTNWRYYAGRNLSSSIR
jgi:hypothetical protein